LEVTDLIARASRASRMKQWGRASKIAKKLSEWSFKRFSVGTRVYLIWCTSECWKIMGDALQDGDIVSAGNILLTYHEEKRKEESASPLKYYGWPKSPHLR
jgi:hypothetical protein